MVPNNHFLINHTVTIHCIQIVIHLMRRNPDIEFIELFSKLRLYIAIRVIQGVINATASTRWSMKLVKQMKAYLKLYNNIWGSSIGWPTPSKIREELIKERINCLNDIIKSLFFFEESGLTSIATLQNLVTREYNVWKTTRKIVIW